MDHAMPARARASVWFWLVAGLSLIWNSFGCADYTMTKLHDAAWIASMQVPAEMIAKIDAAPLWGTTGWALGVWGSLAGSVLLLLRSRLAVVAFAVSFFGALVGFTWQFQADMADPPVLAVVIELIVLALWWLASVQARRRVLR